MKKISVIIPVYNTEKVLRRTLDSVFCQTLTDIEIICVDDCSTDNSLQILNDYKDKIIIISQQQNQGVGIARNAGISKATGEYIAFVDSDDYIAKDFLEKLYNKAKATNADICKGSEITINKGKQRDTSKDINANVKKYGRIYFFHHHWSAIYRTSFIKNNDIKNAEQVIVSQDAFLLVKAVILANKVEVVDDAFYYYVRGYEDGLASDIYNNAKVFSDIDNYLTIIKEIINPNVEKLSAKEYAVLIDQNLTNQMFLLYDKTTNKETRKKIIDFLFTGYSLIIKKFKKDFIRIINKTLYKYLESDDKDGVFEYLENLYKKEEKSIKLFDFLPIFKTKTKIKKKKGVKKIIYCLFNVPIFSLTKK
ncbi:MAG: hypothetical protein Ta2D_07580 [Rickettsiales bacterium]|nr:MAG: hypothetical protein Ta2D_07580 [Rickettsiales bacterium]